ncbi:hypothetical protein BSI_42890 [Bacillus inaquosorum KCTC 13429]|uniref:Uncharacterized protein n=1 Tax=Bacillus inaquosorum KCTC 13429 TaxID=1236548 RepID=A0A9W5LED5_9BACI|nr:hypothetical protein BSI_42890 [Bacillus inaquosorum KCTC 13429]
MFAKKIFDTFHNVLLTMSRYFKDIHILSLSILPSKEEA